MLEWKSTGPWTSSSLSQIEIETERVQWQVLDFKATALNKEETKKGAVCWKLMRSCVVGCTACANCTIAVSFSLSLGCKFTFSPCRPKCSFIAKSNGLRLGYTLSSAVTNLWGKRGDCSWLSVFFENLSFAALLDASGLNVWVLQRQREWPQQGLAALWVFLLARLLSFSSTVTNQRSDCVCQWLQWW